MTHQTAAQLQAGMGTVMAVPTDEGVVRLIVRRPTIEAREVVDHGQLDPAHGLVGDGWPDRPGRSGVPDRYAQLTIMNARYAELITDGTDPNEWAWAGDQLYVDFDISEENLPAGTRLAVGSAIIEISAEPHTGCAKFTARFGSEAWKLANTAEGRSLRLRGANCTVVEPGTVRSGDSISRA